MDARLDGKIALVTGAAQGVGHAIAETLARSGVAGLLLTDRNAERGRAVELELCAMGLAVQFIAADLADSVAPATLVAACLQRFGRIDALVNAAGLTDRASLADGTIEEWATLFDVNARAPFLLMQGAVRAMRGSGGGSIVNILSINTHCGAPDLAIYSASKAALAVLTKNAANSHRFDRIRINGINVGWADTPGERHMQSQVLGHGPGWLEEANAAQPFGRLLAAQDVANLAVFLLSDAAGPMTGALIDQEQWVAGSRG